MMPQHLWLSSSIFRVCEVCLVRQVDLGEGWTPHIGSICPGDDDDPPTSIERRPRPAAPSGKVLEAA